MGRQLQLVDGWLARQLSRLGLRTDRTCQTENHYGEENPFYAALSGIWTARVNNPKGAPGLFGVQNAAYPDPIRQFH